MRNPFWVIAYHCFFAARGLGGVICFLGGVFWILFLASFLSIILKIDNIKDRRKLLRKMRR